MGGGGDQRGTEPGGFHFNVQTEKGDREIGRGVSSYLQLADVCSDSLVGSNVIEQNITNIKIEN